MNSFNVRIERVKNPWDSPMFKSPTPTCPLEKTKPTSNGKKN